MHALQLSGDLRAGDLVLFTQGQQEGVRGATNTLQILSVPTASS